MSTLFELIAKVKMGAWQFWRLVGSMNRDLPFHDYDLEVWEYSSN